MNNPPPDCKPVALKHWGLVLSRAHLDGVRVESAWIAKGGTSSLHYHEHWTNTFTLVSGRLGIIGGIGGGIPHVFALLEAGDTFTIKTSAIHRFLAEDDCHLIEVYSHRRGIPIESGDFDIHRLTPPTPIPRIEFDGVTWRDKLTGIEWAQSRTGEVCRQSRTG